MGNCTVKRSKKASKSYSSSVKIIVPDLYYISRCDKTLLLFESQESTECSLQKKIKLFRDSSISALSDSSLIVAGGSDSSSSLTSRVYQIFPFDKLIRKLPSLPMPCKYGKFHLYKSSLIYLGGVCEAQDSYSYQTEQGSPIFRLKLKAKKWLVYTDHNTFDPSKYLERNIVSDTDKSRVSTNKKTELFLRDLYEPASVLVNSKLYLIGGRICQEDRLVFSDRIFAVLIKDCFKIIEENLRLPVPLQAGSCEAVGQVIIIAGGLLQDYSENLEIFVINFENELVSKLTLTADRPLELRYPIFVKDRGVLCFSPPKMMFLREDKKKIFTFTLPTQVKKSVISAGADILTAEIERKIIDLKIYQVSEAVSIEQEELKINSRTRKNGAQNKSVDEGEIECGYSEKTAEKAENFHCFDCKNLLEADKIAFCEYCKSATQPTFYCSVCFHSFCKACLLFLKIYPMNSLNLTCSNSHVLLIDSLKPGVFCLNCLLPKVSKLFCEICKEHVCLDCFTSLESLTQQGHLCPLLHSLTPSSDLKQTCRVCFKSLTQLHYFKCETCAYSICLQCISNRQAGELIPEVCKSPKEKLSYNFHINESSLYNNSSKAVSDKEVCPFADLDNRRMPDESESIVKDPQCFATPLDEIRRKIPQKPIRGQKSPIILSLSPNKEDFRKNNEVGSPKPEVPYRNSIGAVSADRMSKYTSSYFFPRPLNSNYRSEDRSNPFFKKQAEGINDLFDKNLREEIHSARVPVQTHTKNHLELDLSCRSEKNFFSIREEHEKEQGDLKEVTKLLEKKSEAEEFTETSNKKKQKKSKKKQKKEKIKEINFFKDSDWENSEKGKGKFKETERGASFEEITLIENSRNSAGHELLNEHVGSIKLSIDQDEHKEGFNESSNYFSTLGDDSEQIAPEIGKDIANDKLTALKAKLNLLTDRSSSESESDSFKGFIIGNFPMSISDQYTEESKISYTQQSLKKVIEKLEDSGEFLIERSSEKKVKMDSESEQERSAKGVVSGLSPKKPENSESKKSRSLGSQFDIQSNESARENSGSYEGSSERNSEESSEGSSGSSEESSEESGSFYGFVPMIPE